MEAEFKYSNSTFCNLNVLLKIVKSMKDTIVIVHSVILKLILSNIQAVLWL